MTPKQIISHYGSEIKAAESLGKTKECINKWKNANRIPLWSQYAIAHLSGGKLKADKAQK